MGRDFKHTIVNFTEINTDSILYVKISYTDAENKEHEIKTTVSSCSNTYMYLKLNHIGKINVNCPQTVKMKIVTEETMYQTQTVLCDLIYHSDWVGFSVEKPVKLTRIQDREYYRVRTAKELAIIFSTNSSDKTEKFTSTIFDIALKSIKIYDLQNSNNEPIQNFCFDNSENIKIKIQFDTNKSMTIPATFLKYRIQDGTETYIFQFTNLQANEEAQLSKILMTMQRKYLHNSKIKD